MKISLNFRSDLSGARNPAIEETASSRVLNITNREVSETCIPFSQLRLEFFSLDPSLYEYSNIRFFTVSLFYFSSLEC